MKPMNLTEKIFSAHLAGGGELPAAGEVVTLNIDEAFTQDATGTMCMLQLEAMGVERVKPLSVNFVDHSMMQSGFRNPDDHLYLKTVSEKPRSASATGCRWGCGCIPSRPASDGRWRMPSWATGASAVPATISRK